MRNLLPLLVLGAVLGAQTPPSAKPRLEAQVLSVGEAIVEDPDVVRIIAPLSAELKASFGEVIAEAPQGLFRGRGGEENFLGYWVADLMRSRAAQVTGRRIHFAITNSGGLRANLRPGPVKVGDLYEVMPFENELVVADYTGAEILDIVRNGVQRRLGEPCSGIKAVLSGTVEALVLAITWSDGSPIDPEALYAVATTDYLLASGDSISSLRKGRNAFTTGLPLRQLLLDAAAQAGRLKRPLLPPAGDRFVFPPDLLQALKERRLNLIPKREDS